MAFSRVNVTFTLLYFSNRDNRQARLGFSDTWSLSLIVPEYHSGVVTVRKNGDD